MRDKQELEGSLLKQVQQGANHWLHPASLAKVK